MCPEGIYVAAFRNLMIRRWFTSRVVTQSNSWNNLTHHYLLLHPPVDGSLIKLRPERFDSVASHSLREARNFSSSSLPSDKVCNRISLEELLFTKRCTIIINIMRSGRALRRRKRITRSVPCLLRIWFGSFFCHHHHMVQVCFSFSPFQVFVGLFQYVASTTYMARSG